MIVNASLIYVNAVNMQELCVFLQVLVESNIPHTKENVEKICKFIQTGKRFSFFCFMQVHFVLRRLFMSNICAIAQEFGLAVPSAPVTLCVCLLLFRKQDCYKF